MAKIKTETKNGKVYTYRNGKLFSIQPIKKTAAKSTLSGYGTSSRETASFVNSSVGVGSNRNRIGSVQHTNTQNAQKSQNTVRERKTGKVYKAGIGYQDRDAQRKTYNYGLSDIAKARKAEEAAKNQLKVAEDEQKKLVDRYGSDTAALEASIEGYVNRSDFEQNLDAANKKLSTAQETFNNARNNRSIVERTETLKKQEDHNTFVQNQYTDLMNRDKDAELYIKEGERSRDSAKLFKDININDAWKMGESFAAVGVSEEEDKNAAKVFMNDAERNQYNYLLGKFGKIEADNYYDAIYDDKVAPRFASYLSDMVKADEKDSGIVAAGKTVGRSAQAFLTGAQEGFSGIGAAFRRMTGDTSIDSESLASMTHAEIASKLDGAEKIVNDVVYNVGHMMPTIVTSIATGGLGAPAVVSAIASSSSVGLSSFGNTYEEAIREGYSPDQATAYGILTGVSEGALQYALNGISKIAGGALTGKAVKAAQGAIKRVAKNPQAIKALNLILERSVDASGEFTEEYLQEVLDPVFKNIAYNESNEVKLVSEEALYSGLLGALTAGGMNAATDIQQTASRYLENSRAGVQAAQNNPKEVRIQATPVLNKYAGRETVDGVLGRTYETNMPVLESLAGKDAVLRAVGEETDKADPNNLKVDTILFWNNDYKANADRIAAKNGDEAAAIRLVESVVTPEYANKIAQKYAGAEIVPVVDTEKTNSNVLPLYFATKLAQDTGLTLNESIAKINNTKHAEAKSAFERLVQRGHYTGKITPGQTYYVIADDFVSLGSTIGDLKRYIENQGGKVVGVSTIGASNEASLQITPTKETISKLERIGRNEIEKILQEKGIADRLEDLTESEANAIAREAGKIRSKRGEDSVLHGISDRIEQARTKTSNRVLRTGTETERELGTERRLTENTTGNGGVSLSENNTENPKSEEDTPSFIQSLIDEAEAVRLSEEDNLKKAEEIDAKTAREISSESVEVNPKKKRIPLKEALYSAYDWFERKFIDAGNEVSKLSSRAQAYYNAVRGATQAADYNIGRTRGAKTHATDIYGRGNRGESLASIFEPINKRGEGYVKEFNEYMYHKHNIDRMGLQERALEKISDISDKVKEKLKNPEVREEYKEFLKGEISTLEVSDELRAVLRLESAIEALKLVENKPVFGREVNAEASDKVAREILLAHPEFERFEARVRKYLKNNMEARVESGLVSRELADALESVYPNYVPIYRSGGEETNYSHDNLTVGKTLGRAVGGDGPIGNLEDSIAAQTRSIWKNGRKNIAVDAMMDALSKNGKLNEQVKGEKYSQITPEFERNENTITFFRNGEVIRLTVSGEMAEAFRAFNGVKENKGAVTIRKVNEVYKKLITQYNPTFIVRNFLKDWQDAVIYSKFGVKAFAKNYGRALAGIKNNSAEWQLYCASGGFASSIFENYAETQVENRGKKRNVLQKGVDKISQANMVVEQAPRFAEFLATLEANNANAQTATADAIVEALHNANDITCNFGRSGSWGKLINKYAVPFFNPSIQGFDKLVRTFKAKDAKSCVRAFVGFAAKSAMIGLVPSILNELMHLLSDDDEEKEAWERLSDYTKNTYYCFYIGDGQFFKLPKGRIASIIGNLGQGIARDMLAQSEEDKNDWGAYGRSIVNNVAPTNPLENFIGASLVRTLVHNKKWTGQTIETDEDKKKPVAERYDETTSETAKFMSKNMGLANIGLSPKQIETLIDEGTGVVGDIVLPMTSAQAQQSPIVNSFVTDSNVKNKRSGQVYDLKTQLAQEAYMEGESDVPSKTDLALDFIADSQKAVWDNKDKIKEINMQPITAQEIGRRILGNSDRTKEVSALSLENARINEKILTRYDAFRESLEKNYRVDSSADVDTQKAQVKLAYLKAYREAMGDEATVENVLTDSQKKYCTAAKTKGVDTKTYLDYVEATNGMTKDADRVSALVKMGLPEEKTKSIYEAAIQSSKIKEENSIAYAQRQGISTMEFLKTKYDLDDAALSTTQKTKEAGSSTVIKQAAGYDIPETKEAGSSTVIKQAAGYDIPEYKTETLAKIKNAGVSIEDYAYIDDRIAAYGDKVGYIKSFGFNDKQTSGLVQSLVMGKNAKDKMRVANEEYGISNDDYIRTYMAGYSSVGSKSERNAQIRAFVDSLQGLTDEQKDMLYEYNAVSRGKYDSEKEKSGSSGGKRSSGKRSSSRKKTVPNLSVPGVKNVSISKTRSDIVRSAMQNYMKQKRQSDLTAAYKAQLDEIDKNPFMTQKIKAAQKAKIKERFGIN